MSEPLQWPALAAAAARDLDGTLTVQLGIFGKVHGQSSDYRWIARGAGFAADLPDPARWLRIGSEDEAIQATAWRAPWRAGGRDWFAISTYPSRAVDGFGRRVPLEKCVLHWRAPADHPAPVLAALVLLPQATAFDDRLWWGRVAEGQWARPDYALLLPEEACPPVPVTAAALTGAIATGIAALAEHLGPERLARLYALLHAGVRPALLRDQPAPLPPAALAALLLPLAPAQAAQLSLAAWVPSQLVEPGDLAGNWGLAVTARRGPEPAVDAADLAWGTRLAEALLADAPERLGRARSSAMPAQSVDGPAAALDLPPEPDGQTATVPPEAAREEPELLVDVAEPAVGAGAAGPAVTHPNPRVGLTRGTEAQMLGLTELFDFADRINARRLDLTRLKAGLAQRGERPFLADGEDPTGHPLLDWIGRLAANTPAGVSGTEWQFKVAQLRACALVLLPGPRTLAGCDLKTLTAVRVPALLILPALPTALMPGLARYGADALRALLHQSIACSNPQRVAGIRQVIEQWLANSDDSALRQALADPLQPDIGGA